MAGLDFTTADSVLKEDYLPAIREQLNNTNVILAHCEKKKTEVGGRRAVLSLHMGRSSGVGARATGGTLPTAGVQGYAEERVPTRRMYGRIQINGDVIAAMRSDDSSFTRAVESETKGMTDDVKRDYNRQIWGTSNGVIAAAGTTANSTTLQLAATTTRTQLRQLSDVGLIDIGVVADVDSVIAGTTVGAIDYTNKTVVIGTAVTTTVATLHKVFRAGMGGGGASAGIELTGLQSIVAATGALFNIDPSTAAYAHWASYVSDNSGTNRSISENLAASVIQNVVIESGKEPSLVVSSDGVHRSYANLLTSLKRVVMPNLNLKGGFKGLSVTAGGAELSLVWDRDCPENSMFFLNPDHLALYSMSDWDWMSKDGAVLSRKADLDAYEATIFRYSELTTDQRNAHGLLKDITAS